MFRNEFDTVKQVDKDYPGLIVRTAEFTDQVAHRLNKKDGELRWGRKARNADGSNPNSDGLCYLNDIHDRSKKTIVDIATNSDSENAGPFWKEFVGDNIGNGFWTEPKSADLDTAIPPIHEDPPVVDDKTADVLLSLALVNSKLDSLQAQVDASKKEILDRLEQIVEDAEKTLGQYLPLVGTLLGRVKSGE